MLPARVLLGLFDSIYILALTSWVGAILYFSFGIAPILFKVLGDEAGGRFVRVLFPRYYLWGAISATLALPACVLGPLSTPELRGPRVAVQVLLILFGGILPMLYSGNTLTPEINAARDAGLASRDRFNRLHRRSVRINAFSLLVGLILIVMFATRPAASSLGIIEKSPQERVEYDREVLGEIDRLLKKKPGTPEAKSDNSEAKPGEVSTLDDEGRKELRDLIEAKQKRDEARRKKP